MLVVQPVPQIPIQRVRRPGDRRRRRRRRQPRRVPPIRLAPRERTRLVLRPQRIARRVAGRAMAQPLHQIGPAGRVGRHRRVIHEQQVPARHQRPDVEREGQAGRRRLRVHRRARHQEGVDRRDVRLGGMGVVVVGKRRIEEPAVPVDAVPHRAGERGIGPGADPGRRVRRDVGGVHGAERRLHRLAPGIRRAVRPRMAHRAIPHRRELRALGHEFRREAAGRGRRDRRAIRDGERRRGAHRSHDGEPENGGANLQLSLDRMVSLVGSLSCLERCTSPAQFPLDHQR